MRTLHKIVTGNSSHVPEITDESVNLVVTSPPYPMIEMWDESFSKQDERIAVALEKNDFASAFNLMHDILDQTWEECDRVLAKNGFVCINIGDATRTFEGLFQLFPNRTRIIQKFADMGYYLLPSIIWRKASNRPNKFMGSGMLPAGAYVTNEHEHILIFRKGGKREFKTQDQKLLRRESAYFWEERNSWFSDLWQIQGTSQKMNNPARKRSGAYPLTIPYRLINMYSVKGDTVLDPFAGTGTTLLAAIQSERNSIGIEIEETLSQSFVDSIPAIKETLNAEIKKRLLNHMEFSKTIEEEKGYENANHSFKVKTRQEKEILIREIDCIEVIDKKAIETTYK